MKRLLALLLALALACGGLTGLACEAEPEPCEQAELMALRRVAVVNENDVSGADIVAEAMRWADTAAVYWSGNKPQPYCIAWRTGYPVVYRDPQTGEETSRFAFDCSGFCCRVLNDLGFRNAENIPGTRCVLRDVYGRGYISSTIEDLTRYGEDITEAVKRAVDGDYSGLWPGDIIGWTKPVPEVPSRHVIIYAGLSEDGEPLTVEWTGRRFLCRVIPAHYFAAFASDTCYGARYVTRPDDGPAFAREGTAVTGTLSLDQPALLCCAAFDENGAMTAADVRELPAAAGLHVSFEAPAECEARLWLLDADCVPLAERVTLPAE